jgi:hypothetical protein
MGMNLLSRKTLDLMQRKSTKIFNCLFAATLMSPTQSVGQGRGNEENRSLYDQSSTFDASHLIPQVVVNSYEPLIRVYQVATAFRSTVLGQNQNFMKGQIINIVRKAQINGSFYFLAFNDSNHRSSLISEAQVIANSRHASINDSRYFQLQQTQGIIPLESINTKRPAKTAFAITIDLCQSSKAWEGRLFQKLATLSAKTHKPIPIGIAITGIWASKFEKEFQKLIAYEAAGTLKITWINHSYHHYLKSNGQNFLFMTGPGINLKDEILRLEKLLLEQRQLPSLLFRFPGLVHNKELLRGITDLGLYAIDADTWLAKGEQHEIHNGSVVLVHGNGNESSGIDRILTELKRNEGNFISGEWEIIDPLNAVPSYRAN